MNFRNPPWWMLFRNPAARRIVSVPWAPLLVLLVTICGFAAMIAMMHFGETWAWSNADFAILMPIFSVFFLRELRVIYIDKDQFVVRSLLGKRRRAPLDQGTIEVMFSGGDGGGANVVYVARATELRPSTVELRLATVELSYSRAIALANEFGETLQLPVHVDPSLLEAASHSVFAGQPDVKKGMLGAAAFMLVIIGLLIGILCIASALQPS